MSWGGGAAHPQERGGGEGGLELGLCFGDLNPKGEGAAGH